MKKQLLFFVLLLVFILALTACFKKEHTHTPVTDAAIDATCLESGLSEGSHCADCGEVIVAQETVPAIGHEYSVTVKEPTCSEEGANVHTCVRCSDTYSTDSVAKISHRFGEDGICLGCGVSAPTETIEANTDWYVDTQMAFTLTTKEELAGLATLVNSGTSFNGKTIYLGADIDLEYLEWTPIGTAKYPFTATFDGKGYTISSLRISSDISYVGLFGYAKAEISNFTIDNASVFVKGVQNYVAVACGYSTADIRKVTVDGFVDAKIASNVGGIAGWSAGQLIDLSSTTDVVANTYVGGISGYSKISSAHFKELKNYGSINATGNVCVGGLIGKIESTQGLYVESCENYGNVKGDDSTGGLIGSYISHGSFSMEGCVNFGNVIGGEHTGGVVGYFRRDSSNNTVTIKDFKNNGEVSGFGNVGGIFGYYWCTGTTNMTGLENNGKISGNNQYVGGIAGFSDYDAAVLMDFTNNGEVIGRDYAAGIMGFIEICETDLDIINFLNNANVSGLNHTGGIIGHFRSNGTPSITKCTNTGSVSGGENVGGLVGDCSTREFILSELVNTANISGNSKCVGGIIGYSHSNSYSVTVDNCQNTGDITALEHAGGLFGYISGNTNSTIKNSSVSCNITAQYYVGGIAAEAVNISISECTNTGSSLNVDGVLVSDNTYYAYVGGFVGKGYRVEKCTNEVVIDYTNRGRYVGGIAGHLNNYVSECTNEVAIKGYDFVGGIAGWLSYASEDASSALINTADISGYDQVGGIIGKCEHSVAFTLTDCKNSGNINGNAYVGGIMGSLCRTKSVDFSVSGLVNTGDVVATKERVGGLFGYIYGNGINSVIENSSSSADISGLYFVGGLIGDVVNAALKNSTNAGSTVTATGYYVDGGNWAFLGGYIGCGGYVEGLTNDVDITYDQIGQGVGGIVGHIPNTARYSMLNCTNNGDITSSGERVGGICGDYYENIGNATRECLNSLTNTGAISGAKFVGGIFGNFYANGDNWSTVYYHSTDFTNIGEISGQSNVGEISGYHYTDGESTLTGCTVLGHVTVNGEVVNDLDVDANTNLTIVDRVVYGSEEESAE